MKRACCRVLLAATLVATTVLVRAAPIEAEGVALITSAGIDIARLAALQDAKDQAAMQAGVELEMASKVNPKGVPLESSRIRPIAKLGRVTIIREWQVNNYLHVRISANADAQNDGVIAPQKFRKKITATPFSLRTAYQAEDIDDMPAAFAYELLRRLEISDRFLTKPSRYVASLGSSGPSQDSSAIRRLAALYDSQFVISGDIVDAGSSDEGGYFGMFQKRRRRLDIEVFVHDGLTGSLIARHRISQVAEGDVVVGRGKPFASAAFLATNYGKTVSKVIDAAAGLIASDLDKLPFAAKIVQIKDGNIFVDAGSTSLVAPGDKLVAYHVNKALPVLGLAPDSEFGAVEAPVGTVTIMQVQPLFSIGTLPPSSTPVALEIGDLVRFDSTAHAQ